MSPKPGTRPAPPPEDSEEEGTETKSASAEFMRPFTPSAALAVIVGPDPLPRTEIVMRLWKYIKEHGLQDQKNKRMIKADAALRPIFGADELNMFEMTRKVNEHLS